MNQEFSKHERDYIKRYEDIGYITSFHFDNGSLISNELKHEYGPEEIYIVAEHRYEGMSDPSDMSILYVLETNKDEKGTVLTAYGPSADTDIAEFFNSIPEENISNKENINLKNKPL